jgi:DNA helicase-2/ATP-dependent DNA helicase PcrA
MKTLTKEQEAVVNHPVGNHAKILAVAGSGKTTALVYRIKHLVENEQVNPASIQVLMFNRLAREQFGEEMGAKEANIPQTLQPKVHTFHSFSLGFVKNLEASGRLSGKWNFWIGDKKEEEARRTLKKTIDKLEKARVIPPNLIDSEEAYQAIRLWKGSLIAPPQAGYKGNDSMPLVYEAYESERMNLRALTFDDLIPITVSFLERSKDTLNQYTAKLKYLIVDEYQDVNLGQQRLVELLAGTKADVMVVGDDDQTIFEWRGARPNYIIREFQSIFDNKPHSEYKLSNSFRFGPVIAQCAYNTILFNTNRVQKTLVSHNIGKSASIFLFEQTSDQSLDTNKALTNEVVILIKTKGILPSKIRVLCRMYAQLSGMESEFMKRKIPYRIDGKEPFFKTIPMPIK